MTNLIQVNNDVYADVTIKEAVQYYVNYNKPIKQNKITYIKVVNVHAKKGCCIANNRIYEV